MWINRAWLLRSAEQETVFLPPLGSRLNVWYCETDRPSRPASACPLSTLTGSIWYLLAGFLPLSATASTNIPSTAIGSAPIRVYQFTQLRAERFYCRNSSGNGSVVFKVVQIRGNVFSGKPIDQFCASLVSHAYFLKVGDKVSCTINPRVVPVSPVSRVCYDLAALVKPLSLLIVR